jgi:hypothetical protein
MKIGSTFKPLTRQALHGPKVSFSGAEASKVNENQQNLYDAFKAGNLDAMVDAANQICMDLLGKPFPDDWNHRAVLEQFLTKFQARQFATGMLYLPDGGYSRLSLYAGPKPNVDGAAFTLEPTSNSTPPVHTNWFQKGYSSEPMKID